MPLQMLQLLALFYGQQIFDIKPLFFLLYNGFVIIISNAHIVYLPIRIMLNCQKVPDLKC